MRRFAPTAVAGLFAVAACQDFSTTPMPVKDFEVSHGFTGGSLNPPPPPIDSGAVGVAGESESSNSTGVVFRVTYFFNRTENSGWLKFNKDEFDNTDVDNSAAIKYSSGAYTGKGIVRIRALSGNGMFIFDLSKLDFSQGTVFTECAAPTPTPTATTDGTTDGAPSCFRVNLSGAGATFVPTGGTARPAYLTLNVGKTDPKAACAADFREYCFITSGQ